MTFLKAQKNNHQPPNLMALSILRNPFWTLCLAPQMGHLVKLFTILMHGPPNIITLSNIWPRHHVPCLSLRCCRVVLHNRNNYCLPVGTRSLKLEYSHLWCRLEWTLSLPPSFVSNPSWSFGEECVSHSHQWRGFYLYYVYIMLESPQFSIAHDILHHFEGIWWTHFSSPLDYFQVSHKLGGKTIFIKVKVVDASIDYNFLLGRPSFYDMKLVASFVFHVVCFPHKGKIVTINQLDY